MFGVGEPHELLVEILRLLAGGHACFVAVRLPEPDESGVCTVDQHYLAAGGAPELVFGVHQDQPGVAGYSAAAEDRQRSRLHLFPGRRVQPALFDHFGAGEPLVRGRWGPPLVVGVMIGWGSAWLCRPSGKR